MEILLCVWPLLGMYASSVDLRTNAVLDGTLHSMALNVLVQRPSRESCTPTSRPITFSVTSRLRVTVKTYQQDKLRLHSTLATAPNGAVQPTTDTQDG